MMNTPKIFLCVTTLMVMVATTALPDEPLPAPFPVLVDQYAADRNDTLNISNIPGSDFLYNRLESLYKQWQARLESIAFDTLSQAAKVDYLLVRNDLENGLAEVSRERRQWSEIDAFLAFRHGCYALEQARLQGEPIDSQAAATQIAKLARHIKELRDRVEQGLKSKSTNTISNTLDTSRSTTSTPLVITAPLAKRAADGTEGLRAMLKRWFSFHDGYRPDFSWWVRKPYEEADKALEDYGKTLREEAAGLKGKDDDPIVGLPIGSAALAEAIRHEFIAYDAATLLAIGERELAWCEREMKVASRELGFGDDWKAALAKIKTDYAAPGEQAELITRIAREATAFVKQHKLVTIPPLCEESWGLSMMSPETLKTIPYAAYNGQAMMVAYPRDTMPQDDKLMTMRGNNRHFMRTVTPHELIPGHHLQRYQAARHNRHRLIFNTPFCVEGWALYGERRLWDLGWGKTPEDRMGMLFWRMTRAARVEIALKFHLGQLTPAEAVEFLVGRVGHERFGATSETRRLVDDGFSPLYQASYLLGSIQLEALRTEMVGQRLMTEEDFNNAVLAENAIPVELIRACLLKLPLSRDTQACWKFDGVLLHPSPRPSP